MSLVPKVSICSQVRNQTAWAKEMIQSVVDQTFRNWEWLIVDDGSTEDLKAVVDSFADERIKYHRFEVNRGVPFGMNHNFALAKGKYICWIAADEVFWKDKLREQVKYMDENEAVGASWGLPGGQGEMGLRPEWEQYTLLAHNRSNEAWLRTLLNLEHVPLGGCGMMLRRDVLEKVGYFDENLRVFTDHELFCRFFSQGYKGVVLPFRFANDRPATPESVRAMNYDGVAKELEYVKKKHAMQIPPATGTVSVGIPCYNHAKFLPNIVASLLAQTHPVDEIMILDDGSTDDFKTVAQQFTDPRIKLLGFDKNRGMAEAQNQMAFRAKGDFFLAVSADDTLDPTYVEKVLAKFASDPWLEFVASQTDFMFEDGAMMPENTHGFQLIQRAQNHSIPEWQSTLHGGNVYFGAGMYRTKTISDVGGWEGKYKVLTDYQMYLKILFRGSNLGIVEENLTHTRIHKDNKNMSTLSDADAKDLPWLYHAAKKPFYRKLMKVIIATPFYEVKAYSPYIRSLTDTIRLLTAIGIDYRFVELSGDSYVHRARNTITDQFLRDPDATDLFFVDSDMSWDAEAFVKMCVLPDDVVGAAYPVKNNWGAWTSLPKVYNGDADKPELKHLRGRPLDDQSALIEAHVIAGGFIRIKRSVLERFRDHYKDDWYLEPSSDPANPEHKFTAFYGAETIDHKFFGEDHYFCKKLRDMGVPMFIYPNVNIMHWGTKPYAGNYHKWLKESFDVSKPPSSQVNKVDPDPVMQP